MNCGKPLGLMIGASLFALATPAWAGDGDGDTEAATDRTPEQIEAELLAGGDFDAASVDLKGSLIQQANRVFTKADFERFAPRTALDMVERIPGFSISGSDNNQRGLGQASQNILLNGQRVSAKSNDAATTLSRIDAEDVIRIEVVDGATLDIPGLNGEVANIVYRASSMGGTFEWQPQIRPRLRDSFFAGEISLNGRKGSTEWSASFTNNVRYQGHWGPETVFDPAGDIITVRDEFGRYNQKRPRLAGSLSHEASNGNVLNLNVAGQLAYQDNNVVSENAPVSGEPFTEIYESSEDEWNAELGGDYEFALGGGRLKVIGLQRFEHSPMLRSFTVVDGDSDMFEQTIDESESIVRSEYRWKGDAADWQVSFEGALNTLDSEALLSFTPAGGSTQFIDVPGANANIEEKRAELIFSYGRPLSDEVTLQLNLGGEYSRISVDGQAGNGAQSYWRPKGSASIAWRASPTLAVNAEIERRVDQLNFFDFLAAVDIANDTNRATNISLVPSQRWRGRVEATKTIEGIATLKPFAEFAFIEDKIEIIPVSPTEEALGNVEGKVSALWFGADSTWELSALGWNGARLNLGASYQFTNIEDPLLGTDRDISQVLEYAISADIRHDVSGTDWAWGASIFRNRMTPFYRLDQVSFHYNSGVNGDLFVENKDVAGLTVRATLINLFDSKDGLWRDVYQDRRDGPLAFREEQLREYGRIFQLSVKGNI